MRGLCAPGVYWNYMTYLSHNWNYPENTQVNIKIPYQQELYPTVFSLTHDWLQLKKLQTTQVLLFLQYWTLLYIFSALAQSIWRTFLYAFLHQSWHMDMFPFTPLINYSNKLSLYLYYHYNSITSIKHAPTHHYPNELSQLFVISLSNYHSFHLLQENTVLIPIWSIPSWIHILL